MKWNSFGFEFTESLARLLFQFKQRLCGVAGAALCRAALYPAELRVRKA